MSAYIELLRPVNGLMALAGVFIGAALAGTSLSPIPLQLLFAAVVAFLICSAGMTLNDFFDFHIDRINKPHRPLPSGRIGRRTVLYFAGMLYLSAFILATRLSMPLMFLAAFNAVVAVAYAWKLKRTAIGHFAVSWLVASTFLFGALLTQPSFVVWVLVGMAFSVNLAREIMKAIEDYKGDKANRAKTLAVAFGRDIAGWVAMAFLFLGIALSPMPFIFGKLGEVYMVIIAFADIAAIWAGISAFRDAKRAQTYLKAAMVLVLAAVILGILF